MSKDLGPLLNFGRRGTSRGPFGFRNLQSSNQEVAEEFVGSMIKLGWNMYLRAATPPTRYPFPTEDIAGSPLFAVFKNVGEALAFKKAWNSLND
jgi:hypothetical protein